MGAVYEARQEPLERRVALKTLHADHAKSKEFIARFFNEAKVLSRLEHPSLVQVSDFGHAADGTAYLVMEYLRGQSLGHRIRALSERGDPARREPFGCTTPSFARSTWFHLPIEWSITRCARCCGLTSSGSRSFTAMPVERARVSTRCCSVARSMHAANKTDGCLRGTSEPTLRRFRTTGCFRSSSDGLASPTCVL